MSEWQPIETAPRDGTRVLLYLVYRNDCLPPLNTEGAHVDDYGWHWMGKRANSAYRPSHWMPLPKAPE